MRISLRTFLGGLAVASFATAALADGEVNIYSYRQPQLIEPLLADFTEKTGVKTNLLFLDKGLVERISAEGENSPADVILTVDIGRLMQAKEAGVTAPLPGEVIAGAVPAAFRDPRGQWSGRPAAGRVVYAAMERVEEGAITYEQPADPKRNGRLRARSAQHDYNIALIAPMVAHHGPEKAEE